MPGLPAKRLVYGTVDIDSIAGPSEVAILADRSANPMGSPLIFFHRRSMGPEMNRCVFVKARYWPRIASALTKKSHLHQ